MDRCVVMVDAGYLLGAVGTLLSGRADRDQLDVNYEALVRALIDEASTQVDLPVLRLLWFDAAPDARPLPEHRELRILPDVKVRLGDLVRRNGRLQQKGVDSFIQRDLTTLAHNGGVADVVLIGGDEDVRRSVEEAQDHGVRVHLWGVEAGAPEYNQSQNLIAEADRRWIIRREWVEQYVQARPSTEHEPQSAEAAPASTDQPSAVQAVSAAAQPDSSQPNVVSPKALKKALDERLTSIAPGVNVVPADHRDDIPRLRDLTTAAQAWQDNEEDNTSGALSPPELGHRFGFRWASRASSEQAQELLRSRPQTPRYLDGELLRFAERHGVDTWEDEDAKVAVRRGFWDGVDGGLADVQASEPGKS